MTNRSGHSKLIRQLAALLLALGLLASTAVESSAAKLSCTNLGWDSVSSDCAPARHGKK